MRLYCTDKKTTRYDNLLVAIALILVSIISSCGSSKIATKASPSSEDYLKEIESAYNLDKEQRKLIEEAFSWLGTPYTYAMQDKGVGTDCSGMVMSVYRDVAGCLLPRNSAKQAEFCIKVKEKMPESATLCFSQPARILKRCRMSEYLLTTTDSSMHQLQKALWCRGSTRHIIYQG